MTEILREISGRERPESKAIYRKTSAENYCVEVICMKVGMDKPEHCSRGTIVLALCTGTNGIIQNDAIIVLKKKHMHRLCSKKYCINLYVH